MEVNRKAEIIFTNNGSAVSDQAQITRGLISMGRVYLHGAPKTNMVEMNADFGKGTSSFNMSTGIPAGWRVGDELVLSGTHFRRGTDSEEEKVTITSISGNTINFTPSLTNEHLRVDNKPIHLANITRNIIFRSESSSPAYLRGHVMLMDRRVDIRHAAFVDLGRTNKTIPLDDFQYVNNNLVPGPRTNVRGRYSLHFHRNGNIPTATIPPSKIFGCVVDGTIGWGFVNHSSHVDMSNNVCYDFAGAGFVAEAGDELGNFTNNIAIRGTGNGEYRDIKIVLDNTERPQPLGDFGFGGEGFWFQGPAIRVKNNVANSCNGAGMMWFTTGVVEPDQGNQYTGFPRSVANVVYANFPDFSTFTPRHWNFDPSGNTLVTSDLPILECDNFQAYGCLLGLHLRFNNQGSIDWYGAAPFPYGGQVVPLPGNDANFAIRMRQKVKNLTLWNNEMGFRTRYSTLTDWSDIEIDNRLSYDDNSPYGGAEFNFVVPFNSIHNIAIDGYAVAGWIEWINRNQVLFTGFKNYQNFAHPDTWKTGRPCASLTNIYTLVPGPSSVMIKWVQNDAHNNYLVRYRKQGSKYWNYVNNTTSTTANLTNLRGGTTYEYQITGACDNKGISDWSNLRTYTHTTTSAYSRQRIATDQDSEFNAQTNVALYPNPAYTEFSISIADEQEQVRSIRIYDSYGKLVLEPVVNDLGRYSIEDIGTSGFYTVVIETTSSVISRPLVKLME